MADPKEAGVDQVPNVVSAAKGIMSVRSSDAAEKGKRSEGSTSTPATAGDKVAEMLGRLNLSSQESAAFILDDEEDEYPDCPEWALEGKVLAPNPLHISTIRSVLLPAWGNPKGMVTRSRGTNQFLAEFACQSDEDRILRGSPWNISKNGILLKEFDPAVKPGEIVFDRLLVWARIMHLPYGLMNDTRGKDHVGNLGEVVS